ncbi:MAG: hypothetical protein HYZ73_09585 [Elusimicrobia bacterium]|nr:hypothetical protein [Elusimicrobiota bacterium]
MEYITTSPPLMQEDDFSIFACLTEDRSSTKLKGETLKLDQKQRESLSKALFNLSGYAFTGFVIAQFLPQAGFRPWVFIGGLVFVVITMVVATLLAKEEKEG